MVPPDVLATLDARSAAEGVSRSEALARCVREWQATQAGELPAAGEGPRPDDVPGDLPPEVDVTAALIGEALDP